MHNSQGAVNIISVNDTCDLEEKDPLNLTDHEGVLTAAVAGQSRQMSCSHISFLYSTYLDLEANSDDLG